MLLLLLLLLLLLFRNKFEASKSVGHLLKDFFFRGSWASCPGSELELTNQGSLDRLQAQAELNQAFELGSE